MNNAVTKYAEIKIQIAHLQEELKNLQPAVIESVEKEGGKIATPFGKFAMKKGRTTWEYSEKIEKLSEALKVEQIEEQENGTAKQTVAPSSLSFSAVKI